MTTQTSITEFSPEAPLKQQALIALGVSPTHPVKEGWVLVVDIRCPDSCQVACSGWGKGHFISEESKNRRIEEYFLEMQIVKSINNYPSFLSPHSSRSTRASEARYGRFQDSLSLLLLCLTPVLMSAGTETRVTLE